MNKHCVSLFIVVYFFTINNTVFSQSNAPYSLAQVTENTITSYHKAIGAQSHLYRGLGFEFYDILSPSKPYFKDSIVFANGSVNYDGAVYKNIPLLYDLYKQLLVTYLYNGTSKISLFNDYVTEFDLHGHHFINYKPDSVNRKMDAGFYDVIYNGKHQLLVRRTKSRQEESLTLKKIFIPSTDYYIKVDNKYIAVNSKGKLLDVLKDKKKELKKHISNSNLDFSENKERAILSIVTYYDQISN